MMLFVLVLTEEVEACLGLLRVLIVEIHPHAQRGSLDIG